MTVKTYKNDPPPLTKKEIISYNVMNPFFTPFGKVAKYLCLPVANMDDISTFPFLSHGSALLLLWNSKNIYFNFENFQFIC